MKRRGVTIVVHVDGLLASKKYRLSMWAFEAGKWGALVIGLVSGAVCYGAVCLKPLLRYDDSLDVFGVHGTGGTLGAILTGAG